MSYGAAAIDFQSRFGLAQAEDIGARIAGLTAAGVLKEVGQSSTLPAGVEELSIEEAEDRFGKKWYKRWWVWVIAAAVLAGGTGLTIYLIRRRK